MHGSFPDKRRLADELRLFIGDQPFLAFLQDELHRHFMGREFNASEEIRLLTSYPDYGDSVVLATT